jgi:hypothetical protein
MIDESDLRNDDRLRALLAHYAALGKEDRQAWQDRLDALEGVGPREVTRLHGELLAFGWVEQNTGVAPRLPGRGSAPCCYRVTVAGRRALAAAGD